MAVELEFFSVIVPLENIRRVAANIERIDRPQVRRKVEDALARGIGVWDPSWYDGHLFREGSMGGEGAMESVQTWQRLGLEPWEGSDGGRRWKDLCVALSGSGVIEHPCDWAVYDKSTNCISFATAPRETPRVGPAISRGIEAYESGEYAKAGALLEALAAHPERYGHVKSLRYMATMYAKGQGVERDFGKAAHALLRATEAGDEAAYAILARLYESGRMFEAGHGIPMDLERAHHWYRKAAAAGDTEAAQAAHRLRPPLRRGALPDLKIEVPARQRRIEADRSYSTEEWAQIERGLLPESMDDKWLVFADGERLLVLRSWTGFLFADASFERAADGVRLVHFLAPDDVAVSPEYQRDLLYWVIDYFLLGKQNAVLPMA